MSTKNFVSYGDAETLFTGVGNKLSSLKSGLTTLDNEVNGDAVTYPYADVITIEDAVPANLAECNVKIEPVQDLHGYDHPWVGGAGKNKLYLDLELPYERNGVTITGDGNGGIYLDGTVTGLFSINGVFKTDSLSGQSTICKLYDGELPTSAVVYAGSSPDGSYYSGVQGYDTINNSGSWSVNLYFPNANKTFNHLHLTPMVIMGNEHPTVFEPYENICPISGHTEASVQRDGVNIWDEQWEVGTINGATGNNDTDNRYIRSKNYILIDERHQYMPVYSTIGTNIYMIYYDENKTHLGSSAQSNKTGTAFTPISGAKYMRFTLLTGGQYNNDISINFPATYTSNVPYTGRKTYTLALGDTIYGGTVDFDSGVMTVDRAVVDLGTLNYIYDSTDKWFKAPVSNMKLGEVRTLTMLCECYLCIDDGRPFVEVPDSSIWNSGGSSDIYIKDARYTDQSDFATALDGMQLVYPIATPLTIQLTPQQIQLLKGTNTLTASTGLISVTANGVSGSIGSVQEQVNDIAEDVEDVQSGLDTVQIGLINQTARNRSNITNRLTNLVTAVSEQNLEKYGYKIGDYFTGASGYTYILADMDTYYSGHNNNATVNTHHISLVVKTGAHSKWAETNDTSGGYKASTLHSYLSSTVLDNIKSDMIALFGGSTGLEHLVSHKLLWTTATSALEWSDNAEYISALSEPQVYGTNVWSIDGYQTGEAWKWLEVFHKFNFCEILGNIWWWLRPISSASGACAVGNYGNADRLGASYSGGAVGLIIFH